MSLSDELSYSKAITWLLNEKYGGETSAGFFRDVERLKEGEPLGYVIGWVPFLDAKIYLDSRPLIPRPETEFWVENAIKELEEIRTPNVLDLCAGSGAIGVSVLKRLPTARVWFSELHMTHLATIVHNLDANGISQEHANLTSGDLFENVRGSFDAILSNPPYIAEDHLGRVERSVLEYEPLSALVAGKDGMGVISRLIEEAPGYLLPGGLLYIEHEPEQAVEIEELAARFSYRAHNLQKDQFGNVRFSRLVAQ